jgi:integrase
VQWRETRSEHRNTRSAATSPVVKHLLPFFAFVDAGQTIQRRLSDIDEGLVAQFIERKRQERAIPTDLAEKLAEASAQELQDLERLSHSESADLDEDEVVLLRRYVQRGGCHKLSDPDASGRICLSSRGLKAPRSTAASRRCAASLTAPTAGTACTSSIRPRLRLREDGPNRNWLRPEHLEALIAAARALDEREGRYAHNGREAAIWVLALCRPRVHEFCALTWRDLSDAGLTVRKSKTDAGRRTIQVPTVARAALAAHRARLAAPGADTPIWPTSTGRRRDRNNVRARLLAPVIEAARAALERSEVGEPLPVRVTPHTFRRTAATAWYWLGRDEPATMHEIGHRSSRLTLEVYAQPRPRRASRCERSPDARPWPPELTTPPSWAEPYVRLAGDLGFAITDVHEAATLVRGFIAEIDAAVEIGPATPQPGQTWRRDDGVRVEIPREHDDGRQRHGPEGRPAHGAGGRPQSTPLAGHCPRLLRRASARRPASHRRGRRRVVVTGARRRPDRANAGRDGRCARRSDGTRPCRLRAPRRHQDRRGSPRRTLARCIDVGLSLTSGG